MKQIAHIIINKIADDNYVVNNTLTNKYVRLGLRETNFLLELLGEEQEAGDEDEVILSIRQLEELKERFDEWGFLGERAESKKKKDFSDITLLSIHPEGKISKVLNKTKVLISPIGFALLILSIAYIVYAYTFEGEAILDGLSRLRFNAKSLIAVYFISFLSSIIHELSHASACYKYSGKCGRMGIKLFYLIPAYFCDVSNIYMVSGKKKAFTVASAGVISSHIFGAIVLFIYNRLYHLGTYSNICMLFYLYNLTSIVFNIIPFAKFDGYWMIKAITGIDNLYDKSILLFVQMLLDTKGYIKVIVKSRKKIAITLYGLFLFVFHWGLWGYGIFGMYYFVEKYMPGIKIITLFAMGSIGIINGVKFTMYYISMYRKQKRRLA